jgi:hypothetical protein
VGSAASGGNAGPVGSAAALSFRMTYQPTWLRRGG